MWVFFSSTYLPDPGRVGYTGLEYLPDTFNIKNQRKVGNMCHSDWIRHGIIVKSSIFLSLSSSQRKKMDPKRTQNHRLGGGLTDFFLIFTPVPGEMNQFDEHIFQMGWFNHQPADLTYPPWNETKPFPLGGSPRAQQWEVWLLSKIPTFFFTSKTNHYRQFGPYQKDVGWWQVQVIQRFLFLRASSSCRTHPNLRRYSPRRLRVWES